MRTVLKAGTIGAALVGLCVAAQAAGLAVGKKAEVKVDPKKMAEETAELWKKFGGWCSIQDWHPAIAKCEESKEGADTFRTLTLKDGALIKEKLLENTANRYKYAIISSPLPVKNYEAQFALTPDDDDEDEVNFAWSAVFDAEGKPDKEARDVIEGILKAGVENIEKMAEKPGAKDDDDNEKPKEK